MAPVQSTVEDAKFQIQTALNFVSMARRSDESDKDKREDLLMAYMHAQSGAVIGDCAGVMTMAYYDLKSCLHYAMKALLHGQSVDEALAIYDKLYAELRVKL